MKIHNYNFKYWYFDKPKDRMLFNIIRSRSLLLMEELGMKVVNECHHIFNDESENTGVLLLSTSHFAWHTFPEMNHIAFSFSTCSDNPPTIGELMEYGKTIFECDGVSPN